MTHDPLCPWRQAEESDTALGFLAGAAVCECDLIAKVRQDERFDSLGTRVRELKPYADGYCDGERAMLAKCIAALEDDSFHDLDPAWSGTHWNNAVFECKKALRDLQEKP